MLSQFVLQIRDLFTSNAAPVTGLPPQGKFVKGINLGGAAVTIEGQAWDSYTVALENGLSADATAITTSLIPIPYAPPDLRQMLNTAICKPQILELSQPLPNGTYNVYLWILENYKTDWHSLTVQLGGQPAATEVGKLPLRHWARYGPYQTTLTNGLFTLSLSTDTPTVDAHLMGLSIFQLN